jgi:hypothetical protein
MACSNVFGLKMLKLRVDIKAVAGLQIIDKNCVNYPSSIIDIETAKGMRGRRRSR